MRGYRSVTLTYATAGSAGLDLKAAKDMVIPGGGRALVPTGETVELDDNAVGLVCSRSGLAWEHGVVVLNAPGVIDPDYKGELLVILHNTTNVDYAVSKGDRIAQLVITPFKRLYGAQTASSSPRGDGGLGSTGK